MNNKNFVNSDRSFKGWFNAMWKNFYIQLFAIAIVALVYLFNKLDTDQRWFCFLPVLIMVVVSYFGFYRYWMKK